MHCDTSSSFAWSVYRHLKDNRENFWFWGYDSAKYHIYSRFLQTLPKLLILSFFLQTTVKPLIKSYSSRSQQNLSRIEVFIYIQTTAKPVIYMIYLQTSAKINTFTDVRVRPPDELLLNDHGWLRFLTMIVILQMLMEILLCLLAVKMRFIIIVNDRQFCERFSWIHIFSVSGSTYCNECFK